MPVRAKCGCVCVHRHTGLSIFPLFRFAAVHNRCEITGKISYEHTYFLKFYLYGTLKLEIYEGMKNRHLFWTGEVTLRAKGKFHALTCRTRWKDAQRTRHQCVNMKDKNRKTKKWVPFAMKQQDIAKRQSTRMVLCKSLPFYITNNLLLQSSL